MQKKFWLPGAAGTFAHWGARGCAMRVLVCVICGFIYLFHRKVRKGRKDLRDVPVSF